MERQMRELTLQEIEMVGGGDAAATRIDGTNSWGEITDPMRFTNAQCQATGPWSWSCLDYAIQFNYGAARW
jgi:hypothetical protein